LIYTDRSDYIYDGGTDTREKQRLFPGANLAASAAETSQEGIDKDQKGPTREFFEENCEFAVDAFVPFKK